MPDGTHTKLSVQDIDEYSMKEKKGKAVFELTYNRVVYTLDTGKKLAVNFELLDRIMRGIVIDTEGRQKKKLPKNLLPLEVDVLHPSSIDNGAETIRRMRNGTILTENEMTEPSEQERGVLRRLKEHGAP